MNCYDKMDYKKKPYAPKWNFCDSKYDMMDDDDETEMEDCSCPPKPPMMPPMSCMPPEMPMMQCKTEKTCVKTFKCTYKLYKICMYRLYKVCPKCGYEYDCHQHHMCPRCR